MNRPILLFIVVFALALMSFCNYDKNGAEETKSVATSARQIVEGMTGEPNGLFVKRIEVLIDGEFALTIKLSYDDKNRLVEISG